MNITRAKLKETLRTIVNEESEYQSFFKAALEKAGKSIPSMSDEEKKAFFNKIDSAWDGRGEKNEALVGNQHKLDIDKDGDIGSDDLADLRAGKKINKEESVTEASNDKKRFMFDFYNDSNQRNTERETNFLATTLESAIKGAEHICKVTGYAYVEIYYKDLFLGSMKKQNGFKFVEGKGYRKYILTYELDESTNESVNEGVRLSLVDPNTNKFIKTLSLDRTYKEAEKEVETLNKRLSSSQKTKGLYWKVTSIGESVNEGKKRFKQQNGIGSSKYTISYHDGKKKHKDGSDFFDIKIFKNKPELELFKKDLVSKGFVSESVNEDCDGPVLMRTGNKNAFKVGEKVTFNDNGKKKEYKVVYSKGNGDFTLKLVESVNEIQYKDAIQKFNDDSVNEGRLGKVVINQELKNMKTVKDFDTLFTKMWNMDEDKLFMSLYHLVEEPKLQKAFFDAIKASLKKYPDGVV